MSSNPNRDKLIQLRRELKACLKENRALQGELDKYKNAFSKYKKELDKIATSETKKKLNI